MSHLFQPDDRGNSGRETLPVRALAIELLPTGPGQLVELCPPPQVAGFPLRRDPALLLELVQRRIERSIADLQRVAGDLAEPLADRPAVHRSQCEDLEDQQVKRALNEVGWFAHDALGYREQSSRPVGRLMY